MLEQITNFIRTTFHVQHKQTAVVAVSGGIDSAVSLTLAVRALGAANVLAVQLPHGKQSTTDSQLVIDWLKIPAENQLTFNIEKMVAATVKTVGGEINEHRRGNIMARSRMIVLYDLAMKHQALVVGTENKSEKYLGYFTRFGDEASDLEPIQHLYKTQVRQLAIELGIPEQIISKSPTAGLWQNQTDESELGFSYHDADLVLQKFINQGLGIEDIEIDGVSAETIEKVIARVEAMRFKQQVPYRVYTS